MKSHLNVGKISINNYRVSICAWDFSKVRIRLLIIALSRGMIRETFWDIKILYSLSEAILKLSQEVGGHVVTH